MLGKIASVLLVVAMLAAMSTMSAGAQTTTANPVWSEDFDGALDGWSTGGRFSSWAVAREPDGNGYLTDSPSGPYDIGTDSWAMRDTAFNLSGLTSCVLRLRILLDTEVNADFFRAEASPTGTTWTTLQGWSGSTGGIFQSKEASLGTFNGQSKVYLRFHLVTDGYEAYNDGVSLDDVSVSCTAASSPSPTPTASPTPTPSTSPTSPGDGTGGIIIFSSNRDGDFELYSTYPGGTEPRQLTHNEVRDVTPALSPSGHAIAWVGGEAGSSHIYVMDESLVPQQLTFTSSCGTASFCHSAPAWSPDGKRIAFQTPAGISVVNVDGSGLQSFPIGGVVGEPAWSPNGTKIIFERMLVDENDFDLWTISSSGGSPTRLANTTYDERDPEYSPDGTKIAFAGDPAGDNPRDLGVLVMNADGTGVTRLTSGSDYSESNPSWSPDGARLVFTSDRDLNRELYSVAVDGSGLKRLTTSPNVDDEADWGVDCGDCPGIVAPEEPTPETLMAVEVVKKPSILKAIGLVSPAHDGSDVRVSLYKKMGGTFQRIATKSGTLFDLPSDAGYSQFSVRFVRPSSGTCKFKAFFAGDADHDPSSAMKRFTC